MNFENFLRFELSKILDLPASRQAALNRAFLRFADYVRPLAEQMPKEYNSFVKELRGRIDRAVELEGDTKDKLTS